MLSEKRREIILNLLKLKGFISLNELLEATESSESTIRRDLSHLESLNLLKRVHGGAKSLEDISNEYHFDDKTSKNIHTKRTLAKYASSLINDGDCIFIGSGSTTYEMIEYIKNKDVLVVSNSIKHINSLINKNINSYMICGKVRNSNKIISGCDALVCLSKFRFDKCFLGADGVHNYYGLTTLYTEDAVIKECAINNSKSTYVLVDSSKFNKVSTIKFSDMNQCSIVTNSYPSDENYNDKRNIKVVDL